MLIIKIGGGESINLAGIIADLPRLQEKYIIVHGANVLRDKIAEQLCIEKKILTSVSGYASVYTDDTMIDLIMLAYAGLKNKRIVELCQLHGINAVGLSGLDGRVITGRRNLGIRVVEDGKRKIVRDQSGKPKQVNQELLELLLGNGYIPVLSIPILDEQNRAINSENDDIVVLLQKTFKADKIIQFIEAPGFLQNSHDPSSLLPRMTPGTLEDFEKKATGRMKRKLRALRTLLDSGVGSVSICDGRTEQPLRDALSGSGTIIS